MLLCIVVLDENFHSNPLSMWIYELLMNVLLDSVLSGDQRSASACCLDISCTEISPDFLNDFKIFYSIERKANPFLFFFEVNIVLKHFDYFYFFKTFVVKVEIFCPYFLLKDSDLVPNQCNYLLTSPVRSSIILFLSPYH